MSDEFGFQNQKDLQFVGGPHLGSISSFYSHLSNDWTASGDLDILAASDQLEAAARSSSSTSTFQIDDNLQNPDNHTPASGSSSSSSTRRSTSIENMETEGPAVFEVKSAASSAPGATESTVHSEILHLDAAAVIAVGSTRTPIAADDDAGSFFSSRANLLQELQHQQFLQQRQYMLRKRRKSMYKYTLSPDETEIVTAAGPAPRSPLQQEEFALAKRRRSVSSTPRTGSNGSDDDTTTTASGDSSGTILLGEEAAPASAAFKAQRQLLPLQHEELIPQLEQLQAVSMGSRSSSGFAIGEGPALGVQAAAPASGGLSRGLCLAAFLYCCSRSKLLQLTWQLGLPPDALSFVTRVADADLVLHVKPRPGERHYQYEDVSSNALAVPQRQCAHAWQYLSTDVAPFGNAVALKPGLSVLPAAAKPRGNKRRYTAIKLPPA
eukprot:gene3918-4172_t